MLILSGFEHLVLFFLLKWNIYFRGCSQRKLEVVYVMGAQTRLGGGKRKKKENKDRNKFFFCYLLSSFEL